MSQNNKKHNILQQIDHALKKKPHQRQKTKEHINNKELISVERKKIQLKSVDPQKEYGYDKRPKEKKILLKDEQKVFQLRKPSVFNNENLKNFDLKSNNKQIREKKLYNKKFDKLISLIYQLIYSAEKMIRFVNLTKNQSQVILKLFKSDKDNLLNELSIFNLEEIPVQIKVQTPSQKNYPKINNIVNQENHSLKNENTALKKDLMLMQIQLTKIKQEKALLDIQLMNLKNLYKDEKIQSQRGKIKVKDKQIGNLLKQIHEIDQLKQKQTVLRHNFLLKQKEIQKIKNLLKLFAGNTNLLDKWFQIIQKETKYTLMINNQQNQKKKVELQQILQSLELERYNLEEELQNSNNMRKSRKFNLDTNTINSNYSSLKKFINDKIIPVTVLNKDINGTEINVGLNNELEFLKVYVDKNNKNNSVINQKIQRLERQLLQANNQKVAYLNQIEVMKIYNSQSKKIDPVDFRKISKENQLLKANLDRVYDDLKQICQKTDLLDEFQEDEIDFSLIISLIKTRLQKIELDKEVYKEQSKELESIKKEMQSKRMQKNNMEVLRSSRKQQKELNKLKQTIDLLQLELQQKMTIFDQLKQQHLSLGKKYQNLDTKYKKNVEEMHIETQKFTERQLNLKQQMKILKELINQLKLQKATLIKQNQQMLQQKSEKYQIDRNLLIQELNQKNEEVHKHIKDFENIKNYNNQLKQQIELRNNQKQQLDQLLHNLMNITQSERKDMEKLINQKNSEHRILTQNIQNLSQKIENINVKANFYQGQYKKIQKVYIDSMNREQLNKIQIERLLKKIEMQQKQKKQLYRNSIQEKKELIQQNQRLQDQLKERLIIAQRNSDQQQILRQTINKLRQKQHQTTRIIQKNTIQIQKYETKILKIQNQFGVQLEELKKMQKLRNEERQKQKLKYQNKQSQCNQTIQSLKQQNKQLQISFNNQQLDKLQIIKKYHSQLQYSNSVIAKLTYQTNLLKSQYQQLQQSKSQLINQYESILCSLNMDILSKQQSNTNYTRVNQQLQQKEIQLNQKIKSLQKKLQEVNIKCLSLQNQKKDDQQQKQKLNKRIEYIMQENYKKEKQKKNNNKLKKEDIIDNNIYKTVSQEEKKQEQNRQKNIQINKEILKKINKKQQKNKEEKDEEYEGKQRIEIGQENKEQEEYLPSELGEQSDNESNEIEYQIPHELSLQSQVIPRKSKLKLNESNENMPEIKEETSDIKQETSDIKQETQQNFNMDDDYDKDNNNLIEYQIPHELSLQSQVIPRKSKLKLNESNENMPEIKEETSDIKQETSDIKQETQQNFNMDDDYDKDNNNLIEYQIPHELSLQSQVIPRKSKLKLNESNENMPEIKEETSDIKQETSDIKQETQQNFNMDDDYDKDNNNLIEYQIPHELSLQSQVIPRKSKLKLNESNENMPEIKEETSDIKQETSDIKQETQQNFNMDDDYDKDNNNLIEYQIPHELSLQSQVIPRKSKLKLNESNENMPEIKEETSDIKQETSDIKQETQQNFNMDDDYDKDNNNLIEYQIPHELSLQSQVIPRKSKLKLNESNENMPEIKEETSDIKQETSDIKQETQQNFNMDDDYDKDNNNLIEYQIPHELSLQSQVIPRKSKLKLNESNENMPEIKEETSDIKQETSDIKQETQQNFNMDDDYDKDNNNLIEYQIPHELSLQSQVIPRKSKLKLNESNENMPEIKEETSDIKQETSDIKQETQQNFNMDDDYDKDNNNLIEYQIPHVHGFIPILVHQPYSYNIQTNSKILSQSQPISLILDSKNSCHFLSNTQTISPLPHSIPIYSSNLFAFNNNFLDPFSNLPTLNSVNSNPLQSSLKFDQLGFVLNKSQIQPQQKKQQSVFHDSNLASFYQNSMIHSIISSQHSSHMVEHMPTQLITDFSHQVQQTQKIAQDEQFLDSNKNPQQNSSDMNIQMNPNNGKVDFKKLQQPNIQQMSKVLNLEQDTEICKNMEINNTQVSNIIELKYNQQNNLITDKIESKHLYLNPKEQNMKNSIMPLSEVTDQAQSIQKSKEQKQYLYQNNKLIDFFDFNQQNKILAQNNIKVFQNFQSINQSNQYYDHNSVILNNQFNIKLQFNEFINSPQLDNLANFKFNFDDVLLKSSGDKECIKQQRTPNKIQNKQDDEEDIVEYFV